MTGRAEDAGWLDLCHTVLGVPLELPGEERRQAAAAALLAATGQDADILGMGAAEAAIDLVVRHGEAGRLDEVLLPWEQGEILTPEVDLAGRGLGDAGTARATACAKALVRAVVAHVEGHRPDGPDQGAGTPG